MWNMRNTESVDHEEHRVCGTGGGCVDRQSEEPEGIIPEQVRLMGVMHIRAEVHEYEYTVMRYKNKRVF